VKNRNTVSSRENSLEYIFSATADFTPGNEYHIAFMKAAQGDEASSDDAAGVIINRTGVTRIETRYSLSSFSVYPNHPLAIYNNRQAANIGNAEIKITDMFGKTVYKNLCPAILKKMDSEFLPRLRREPTLYK